MDSNDPRITLFMARKLMKKGWKAMDMHCHTWCSEDVWPVKSMDPKILFRETKKKGMGFVTFTDHDNFDAFGQVGKQQDLVTGVELEIYDKRNVGHTVHINVFDLTRKDFDDAEKICRNEKDIYKLIKFLERRDLPFTYNHPYWCYDHETLKTRNVLKLAKHFPVIEYNMGSVPTLNNYALALAQSLGKGVVATTDSHIGEIGKAYTVAPGKTFREFFENIKLGNSFIVPQDLTKVNFGNEINTRISQIFGHRRHLSSNHDVSKFTMGEPTHVSLDKFIQSMHSKFISKSELLRRATKGLIKGISISGLPAYLHLRKKHSRAQRIAAQLRRFGLKPV